MSSKPMPDATALKRRTIHEYMYFMTYQTRWYVAVCPIYISVVVMKYIGISGVYFIRGIHSVVHRSEKNL